MQIWAHRGCSSRFPENTLTSFREACRYDIAGIELDAHMTRDGEIAVIHDETVDRTLEGTGEIRAYSLAELQGLAVRARSTAPTELLYPAPADFPKLDLAELEAKGITDLFTNVPERYCRLAEEAER